MKANKQAHQIGESRRQLRFLALKRSRLKIGGWRETLLPIHFKVNTLRALRCPRLFYLSQITYNSSACSTQGLHLWPASQRHDDDQQTRIKIGCHASQDHAECLREIPEHDTGDNWRDKDVSSFQFTIVNRYIRCKLYIASYSMALGAFSIWSRSGWTWTILGRIYSGGNVLTIGRSPYFSP